MARNQNHNCVFNFTNFTKLSFRQQDNYHHSINIMISSSYHLFASPPPLGRSHRKHSLGWQLDVHCTHCDLFYFGFSLFPEGRLEDTPLSQKFSPFFKLQRWSEKKLVERGRDCTRLLWLMRPLCRTWICGAFLSDFFTNLGYILTFCKINICVSLTQLQRAVSETCDRDNR